ncbi:migration and invasion-inhibitory protein isoform X6 [Mobula birostris]|uniref:migration and invasion-inhibitory protein isoform X6 n=1 Tax=Mobula birostris TaxID=1983395 RepID=UPI003B283FDD
MSYFDRLQFLRDQNKQLLQRLREERLRFASPSSEGLDSAVNGTAADYQRNSYKGNRLEGDRCFMRNSSMKYKTCELLEQEMKNGALQQPSEKDVGHVTFQSPEEESSLSTEVRSVQPLLGYDWIAGLIDVDSPLSEQSEEYFLELQNFRRVNKEECVHQDCTEYVCAGAFHKTADTEIGWGSTWEKELNDKITDQEEHIPNSQIHQCTHSYRVNSRLFAVPLEPAAACPVCKTPKSKRPHTLEEPAYIRVSIPRSTLLPPHKYKPHRRKSFNPTDSLSLPSHCLLGWENSMPSAAPVAGTLDLRSALEHKRPSVLLTPNCSNMGAAAVSRVAGSTRSDELLDLSRSTQYQFQKLEQSLKLR